MNMDPDHTVVRAVWLQGTSNVSGFERQLPGIQGVIHETRRPGLTKGDVLKTNRMHIHVPPGELLHLSEL